jgi:hypothetical protein
MHASRHSCLTESISCPCLIAYVLVWHVCSLLGILVISWITELLLYTFVKRKCSADRSWYLSLFHVQNQLCLFVTKSVLTISYICSYFKVSFLYTGSVKLLVPKVPRPTGAKTTQPCRSSSTSAHKGTSLVVLEPIATFVFTSRLARACASQVINFSLFKK